MVQPHLGKNISVNKQIRWLAVTFILVVIGLLTHVQTGIGRPATCALLLDDDQSAAGYPDYRPVSQALYIPDLSYQAWDVTEHYSFTDQVTTTAPFGEGQPHELIDLYTVPSSSVGAPFVRFRWDFGDGSAWAVTAVPTVTHAYQDYGIYHPQVEVTDVYGHQAVSEPGYVRIGRALLSLKPWYHRLRVTEETVLEIAVSDVITLYNADFTLTFDPAVLQATAVEVGDFFDPAHSQLPLIVQDNQTGLVRVVQSLKPPAEPRSGSGTLARVTLVGAGVGISELRLQNVTLADPNGRNIPATTIGGWAQALTNLGILEGTVTLQGRTDHRGVMVEADGQVVTSDLNGDFLGEVPMGARQVRASHPGYLWARRAVEVVPEETIDLPEIMLRGGDANNDGVIDALDLAIVGAALGSIPPADPRADITGDGRVDANDLILVGLNFGWTAPGPW